MKLNAMIRYQCRSAVKPLCIFYGILYSLMLFGVILAGIAGGGDISTNGAELSCFVYLCFFGSLCKTALHAGAFTPVHSARSPSSLSS